MAARNTSLAGRIDIDQLLAKSKPKVTSKPYICTNCGHQALRATNHYGACYPNCYACNKSMSKHVFDHKRAVLLLANKKEQEDGSQ